jgi:hypothetical protein
VGFLVARSRGLALQLGGCSAPTMQHTPARADNGEALSHWNLFLVEVIVYFQILDFDYFIEYRKTSINSEERVKPLKCLGQHGRWKRKLCWSLDHYSSLRFQ